MTATPLTEDQAAAYHRDGYLLLGPDFLPAEKFDSLAAQVPSILTRTGPQTILERDGSTVRSVYGVHQDDAVVADFVRIPDLLGAARRLLGDDVYVHQSKINNKAAFSGDEWEWHQDHITWLRLDGIRSPALVNVAVFLDDVTEFNGPLTLVPGSHRDGLLPGRDRTGMPSGYEDAPNWVNTLTSEEEYRIDRSVIRDLIVRNGLFSARGPARSVLLFHSNVLHASMSNISPFDRKVLIFVYNGVGNVPEQRERPRPEFLAARSPRALAPLSAAASSS
jgi:ectoine hydroxylase